jgi:hypothetical protein
MKPHRTGKVFLKNPGKAGGLSRPLEMEKACLIIRLDDIYINN